MFLQFFNKRQFFELFVVQGYALEIHENVFNWYGHSTIKPQLMKDRLDENLIQFLIFLMKLDFLVVDSVQQIL